LGSFYRRPGAGRVLLAGDAAGCADPLLGEGIYYAHASGYLAAEALMGPDPTGHAAVDTYASRLNKSVFRELVWADVWRGALHGLGAWNQYRLLPWLFRRRGRSLEAMVHGRRSFGPGRLNAI